MKPSRWLFALILLVGVGLSANAPAADKIGVVVLHGKWDSPDGHTRGLAQLPGSRGVPRDQSEDAVVRPACLRQRRGRVRGEIDAAIADLRAKGAGKIAILGHSQGASAALYYATLHRVNGIALIALGGQAQSRVFSGSVCRQCGRGTASG